MDAEPQPLLAADEPAPFEVVNGAGRSRAILTCDHASKVIPRRLGDLGISAADRERHVAWDIGAAAVARRLSEILDSPLVLAGYSRLVIDCNRPLDQPDAFVTQSEDVRVPGNEGLSAAEQEERTEALFWPYHDRVNALVAERASGGGVPVVVAVHSFTPVYHGDRRPWHIGVLHRWDRRLADLTMAGLSTDGNFHIGDNQPYSVELDEDYTVPVHAERRGLPTVLVEIRQDLIASDAGARDWAERLGAILTGALGHGSLAERVAPAPDVREPRFE